MGPACAGHKSRRLIFNKKIPTTIIIMDTTFVILIPVFLLLFHLLLFLFFRHLSQEPKNPEKKL